MFCHRCFPIRCLVPWHARARAPAGPGGRARKSCRASVLIAVSTTSSSCATGAARCSTPRSRGAGAVSDAASVPRRALAGCRWRDGTLFSRTGLRSVRENNFHRKFDRLAMCRCSRGALRVSSRTRWCGHETRRQCSPRSIFQNASARASSRSSHACKTGAVMRALADTSAIARGRVRGWQRRCVVPPSSQLRQRHLRNAPNEARDAKNFPTLMCGRGERCAGAAWSRLARTQAGRLATIGSP